jgi:hypothetical protein
MSVSSLTTLGAVRDERAPSKADVGKTPPEDAKAEEPPSLTDLLVTAVPTELVAAYTAAMAAIVGAVDKPVEGQPLPDQLEAWRWVAFAALLFATAGAIVQGIKRKRARKKSRVKRFPLAELAAGMVAAAGWGLALPASPLDPYVSDDVRTFLPLLIALVAVGAVYWLGGSLKKQAS